MNDLPGYYFDNERQKYYKVQPNHTQTGQQHSKQVIGRKAEIEESRTLKRKRTCLESSELISRSRLGTHPLLGRIGVYNRIRDSTSRAHSANPNESVAASFAADLEPRKTNKLESGLIADFVVNEATGLTVLAFNAGRSEDHYQEVGGLQYVVQQSRGQRSRPRIKKYLEGFVGRFSSMAVAQKVGKLCYASSEPLSARIGLLDLPTDYNDVLMMGSSLHYNIAKDTVWQIESAPIAGDFFAIASSTGLRTLNILPHKLQTFHPTGANLPKDRGFQTVAFGAVDRLIYAGQRSGLIQLCDTRSQGAALRVLNSDGAAHIKSIDENRVVIRGTQQMNMYDLRFAKPLSHNDIKHSQFTTPYRIFPLFSRSTKHRSGLAYDPQLGILATASTQDHEQLSHCVELYSVRTGKKLATLADKSRASIPYECVKFSRAEKRWDQWPCQIGSHDLPVALLASQGTEICEWGPGGKNKSVTMSR